MVNYLTALCQVRGMGKIHSRNLGSILLLRFFLTFILSLSLTLFLYSETNNLDIIKIRNLKLLKLDVPQKSRFRRNRFCRVTPTQFIRYLKNFYKANLDINKLLHLWVLIWTLLNFRTFWSTPFNSFILLLNSSNGPL